MLHPQQSVRRSGIPWVTPLPRSEQPELLDDTTHDPAELAANFRDIRRVNAMLGGTSLVLRHLPRLISTRPPEAPITILDLATGCADIPVAIARWADRRTGRLRSWPPTSRRTSALAGRAVAGSPHITLAQYDARNVPLPARSFDIVTCSLSLHHFTPDDAVRVLGEMNRLARRGCILNDLRRGRLGYIAAWVAAHLTTRNRLTRNDAPLSVRRAYTPSEVTISFGRPASCARLFRPTLVPHGRRVGGRDANAS